MKGRQLKREQIITEGSLIAYSIDIWEDIPNYAYPERDITGNVNVDSYYEDCDPVIRLPERQLMAAILKLAIYDSNLEIDLTAKNVEVLQQQARTAVKWIESNNRSYVLSFINVNESLDLDYKHMRRFARDGYNDYIKIWWPEYLKTRLNRNQ